MLCHHCTLLFRGNNKENYQQGLLSSDGDEVHFSPWLSEATPQHSLPEACTVPKQLLHRTFPSWLHISRQRAMHFLGVHTRESLVAVFKQHSSRLGLVLTQTLEAKPDNHTSTNTFKTFGLTVASSKNIYGYRSSIPRSRIPLCLVRHKQN